MVRKENIYLLSIEEKKAKQNKTNHIYSCKTENKLIYRW